jgi:hypothetical protein
MTTMRSTTPCYYLPKISAPTLIAIFVGFKNQPLNTNINPLIQKWNDFNYFTGWSSFVTSNKDLPINQFLYHI